VEVELVVEGGEVEGYYVVEEVVTVKEVLKEVLFQTLLGATFRRFSDSICLQWVPIVD